MISSDIEDREEYSDRYRYNSDYVRMFDSIGIIELDASQNRALAGGGATRKKILGGVQGRRYNEILVQKKK